VTMTPARSFWSGPFLVGLGLVLAVAIGIGWYILGGFPQDHDRYGTVAVPGQAVLILREGDVTTPIEGVRTTTSQSSRPASRCE
jgi:hypothetical protein